MVCLRDMIGSGHSYMYNYMGCLVLYIATTLLTIHAQQVAPVHKLIRLYPLGLLPNIQLKGFQYKGKNLATTLKEPYCLHSGHKI